mmetsp:Transcript_38013/g.123657  ORF Transcript_38013/g.123657 Transcript_38013/m.123657 type:complete len:214 (+) Transcript_38013:810-1451(+)
MLELARGPTPLARRAAKGCRQFGAVERCGARRCRAARASRRCGRRQWRRQWWQWRRRFRRGIGRWGRRGASPGRLAAQRGVPVAARVVDRQASPRIGGARHCHRKRIGAARSDARGGRRALLRRLLPSRPCGRIALPLRAPASRRPQVGLAHLRPLHVGAADAAVPLHGGRRALCRRRVRFLRSRSVPHQHARWEGNAAPWHRSHHGHLRRAR